MHKVLFCKRAWWWLWGPLLDLNPNGQQSTHIQLAPHRLNNTTGCSTVSVFILMRTMVVFGSWSQTLFIWRPSFYNSHQEYIVQYLDLHLCSLAIIWEKRAQLVCSVCRIEWFRIEVLSFVAKGEEWLRDVPLCRLCSFCLSDTFIAKRGKNFF